jgi:hypothetical protein
MSIQTGASKEFIYEGGQSIGDVYGSASVPLKAIARSEHEASELHTVVGMILRYARTESDDLELEARLTSNSPELDAHEPTNVYYNIVVTPTKGSISGLSFSHNGIRPTFASRDFADFFWLGLPHYYKGGHHIRIFYRPQGQTD